MTCSMSMNKANEFAPGFATNALGLVGGIALGLGAIAGWQWWQGQQLQGRMAVNGRYADAVARFESGSLAADKGRATIDAISKANATLGALAALQLARSQVDAGKTRGCDRHPAQPA